MFKWLFTSKNSDKEDLSARKEPIFGRSPNSTENASAKPKASDGALAQEGVDILRKFMMAEYTDERGVHLETILSAVAALAGYQAQQAGIAVILAGDPEARKYPDMREVIGDDGRKFLFIEYVNQLVASPGGTDQLTVLRLVANGGLKAGGKNVPDMRLIMQRNAQALGSDNYPPLSVPVENSPRENALTALRRWWPIAVKIYSVDGFNHIHPLLRMYALAHLAGQLIEEGKNVLNPDTAMLLAMETAVAMSKVTGIDSSLSTAPAT